MRLMLLYLLVIFTFTVPVEAFNKNTYEAAKNRIVEKCGNQPKTSLGLLYQANELKPIWITPKGWTSMAKQFMKILASAEQHGLEASSYRNALDLVANAQTKPAYSINAEFALSHAVLQYIDDIRNGRINPKAASKNIAQIPDPVDPGKILIGFIRSGKIDEHEMIPPYKEYSDLVQMRRRYSSMASKIEWPKINLDKNKKLEMDDKGGSVITLRKILLYLGDLTEKTNRGGDVFDEDLMLALRTFQVRHGLEPDGIIGAETVNALNITPKDRVDAIDVALERWRWMPRNPGDRHVLVNIPAFELRGYDNSNLVLYSPIIVGMHYRKTPVFSAVIREVKFHPDWNIPVSIAIKDKLPKIRRHKDYIERMGLEVYDTSGGSRVRIDPNTVDWSNINGKNMKYHFRQPPGSKNALGKVRFTIDTPYGIYLHDTSNPELFNKVHRAFSSGCIRVQKVQELAEFLFNDSENWSNDRLTKEFKGHKTKRVALQNPIPVHITYFRVWQEDGKDYFYPDVYGQDKLVWDALASVKSFS